MECQSKKSAEEFLMVIPGAGSMAEKSIGRQYGCNKCIKAQIIIK